jgi:hypothetical protein
MMRLAILILMLGVGVSSNATAACRTFHYDHDGNPYTPLKFRVACEKTYAVRTIPKYRIETQDVATATTRPRDPRHIKLSRPKPQCIIPSVYQFTMMQTLSQCATTR